ncbi:septation protein SepH [Cellulomonas taurus]|uniref:septation protein SepH n=1 Tax=Cellulomonas taurus TaxID=2729175 RepID=UPI00145CB223|nr:septation protein SepH [Cellulomonas taurus]
MAELELVGLHEDGEHLVLAAADGQRYLLPIDDPLRAAVRRDRPQLEQLRAERSGAPSPREIQARVRAGQSAEQIAEDAGLSVEHVRRFEGPVVAEREYLAQQARATRVGRDVGAPELGDLVVDRLASRGVDAESIVWDAYRLPGQDWTVLVRFTVEEEQREARWSFDPSARSVHAEEDEARWLSETEIADGPLSRRRHLSAVRDVEFAVDESLRPVLASVDRETPQPEPEPEPTDPTQDLLDDLRARRGQRQTLDVEQEDEDDFEGFDGFGPQSAFDFGLLDTPAPEPADSDDDAPGAHPVDADPLAQARVYPVPSYRPTVVPADDTAPEKSTPEPSAKEEAKAKPRRGRAKVPSWDEIVFGAKPE